jgi:hypothetical protein
MTICSLEGYILMSSLLKPSFYTKAELLLAAENLPELTLRFKQVRAAWNPALSRTSFERAVQLNVVLDYTDWLVKFWDNMDEDQRKPFAFDCVMRGLLQSGQRVRALKMANMNSSYSGQAWRKLLTALLP